MFIKVKGSRYDDEMIINTDNISIIWEHGTIVMNGSHGEGNGILNLTKESMELLLKKLGNIDDNN